MRSKLSCRLLALILAMAMFLAAAPFGTLAAEPDNGDTLDAHESNGEALTNAEEAVPSPPEAEEALTKDTRTATNGADTGDDKYIALAKEKAQDVDDLIAAIGSVDTSGSCLQKIEQAEAAYAALFPEEQRFVSKLGDLRRARAAFENLSAKNVDTTGFTVVQSGKINTTIRWYLYDNGTLEITGTGSVPSYSKSSTAPWYEYRASITTVIVRDTVTSIGSFAFYGCDKLTSITLPFVGNSRAVETSSSYCYENHLGYIFGYSTSSVGNDYQGYYYYYSGSYSYYYYFYIPISLTSVTVTDATAIGDYAFS
ncbi:MAG: leucine-rich repeat protein, partial [Firmicutes bacterium]|nr:leucine-rich repeat protein [Bacillota bacterium]